MAINRQFTLFSLQNLAYAKLRNLVIKSIKTNNVIPNDLFAISAGTTQNQQVAISDIFQNVLLDVLLHAVVDDDRKTAQIILNAYPELVLVKALKGIEIQSQYTWLKIDAENEDVLSIAAKRKQIEMVKLLLPYYDKLEQTEEAVTAKMKALSAWKAYEIQKNEIVIPKDYADYAQSLIEVFKKETFPNGVPDVKDVPINTTLSEQTELALSSLLNILVPKTAVKLDEHIDVELLLLAIYKAYVNNFPSFNSNWDKLKMFCIRVIGLTQRALIPETGAIFCEGLMNRVAAINKGEEKKLSAAAASHKLKLGEDFYRLSRDSHIGLGFEFLCGMHGVAYGGRVDDGWRFGGENLDELCQAKTTDFWKCCAAIAVSAGPSLNKTTKCGTAAE